MAGLDGAIVQVTWHDAHSLDNNEWHELGDIDDQPLVCVVCGHPKAVQASLRTHSDLHSRSGC
jgi:hypothetical protein